MGQKPWEEHPRPVKAEPQKEGVLPSQSSWPQRSVLWSRHSLPHRPGVQPQDASIGHPENKAAAPRDTEGLSPFPLKSCSDKC